MLAFDIYSPEEEVFFPIYAEKGVRLFVKRDDMIHPYISGNKWRKLKHPLARARETGKSLLVTFGGAWSNHLLATACAGAKFGFRTQGFVRGEAVRNPVLAICRLFGMELHFTDRTAYRDKTALFGHYFGRDAEAFCIDEGGRGADGARGAGELLQELGQSYDHCFCACGTGTTLAGLALANGDSAMQMHGVPVLKGGEFLYGELEKLGADPEKVHLHTDYHFGGYAKAKPELLAFVRSFAQRTGIMIEPTYTGKLFYALHDLIQRDFFPPGSKILAIHTGGLTGFLGHGDAFDQEPV